MRKFAVIGLGQYGFQVAVALAKLGADVLAIDKNSDICESVKRHQGVHPLSLDATDEAALRASGIDEVDAVVVAIGQHLEISIVVTALLRRLSVRRIIARSSTDLHEQILRLVGATQVHNPEVEMGTRVAHSIFAPDVHDRMSLPTGHQLVEIDARESTWGRTLSDLDFRTRYELAVIAIRKRVPFVDKMGESSYRSETNMLPTGADIVERGDILAVLGTEARVREFLDLWQ